MRNSKRLVVYIICALLVFPFAACGKINSDDNDKPPPQYNVPNYVNEADIGDGYEHILLDRRFTDGFGCEWNFGRKYSIDDTLRRGDVLYYRDIGQPFYVLPAGLATVGTGSNGLIQSSGLENSVSWQFEEGAKSGGLIDLNGKHIQELHSHRMVVNSTIQSNTENLLKITQDNDYLHQAYPEQYPNSDPKRVKSVESDRNGSMIISYNSYNDISNSAYAYGNEFALNNWPHLLIHQSFSNYVNISKYSKIDFGMTVKVNKADKINDWPQGASGRADQPIPSSHAAVSPAETTLQTYFFIRQNNNPYVGAFIGVMLNSSNNNHREEYSGLEQHGLGFYRVNAGNTEVGGYFDMKGGWVGVGEETSLSLDLKKMINYVLIRHFNSQSPQSSWYNLTADDVSLSMFNLGYEYIGNWDCEFEVSNIYARGVLK